MSTLQYMLTFFLLLTIFTNEQLAAQHIKPSAILRKKELNLSFTPKSEEFSLAAEEYKKIWQEDGAEIERTLKQVSKLTFPDKSIKVIVFEGISYSGRRGKPMRLRASYPYEIKKAVLIHELGHRLQYNMNLTDEIDLHRALNLFLYDVWTNLYGQEWADKSVDFEKSLKGLYDYESAWNWALSLTKEERVTQLEKLVRYQDE